MRVVALKAWSNGSISMEERQIAELSDALATSLIAQGIVAPTALPEITDVDDGKVLTADSGEWVAANPSSSGGVLVVHYTDGTLDKTWQEIHDAMLSWGAVINHTNTELGSFDEVAIITDAFHDAEGGYGISVSAQGSGKIAPVFYSQTADGYPVVG